MSAPSDEHEDLVRVLEACGTLSGHTVPVPIGRRLLPDVVLLDAPRRRLFVGDAKATETPGCTATGARLHAYARAASGWQSKGFAVRLAVCHQDPAHAAGWASLVEHSVRCAGRAASDAVTSYFDAQTVITWVDVQPSTSSAPRRFGPRRPAAGPLVSV